MRKSQTSSVSPVAPGTLYLVHDDRSRSEVNVTMWNDSDRMSGSIAIGRLTPGDTLILLKVRGSGSSKENVKVWDIFCKGKTGYIYVDRDTIINFRRVSWIDD